MGYRKSETTARMNERDYPHIVVLVIPANGFGRTLDAMMAFHRERGIEYRRGRSEYRAGRDYCRWCFADAETAEAFRVKFGGAVVTPDAAR
jgi:hypothetical protein